MYPKLESERQEIRDTIAEILRRKAEKRALRHGRSLRCFQNDHGCRNNGETCLCFCHDKKNHEDTSS